MNRSFLHVVRGAALAAACLVVVVACDRAGPRTGVATGDATPATSNDPRQAHADASAAKAGANTVAVPAAPAADASDSRGATPVYRELRDVIVACDNVRRCTVTTAAEDVDASPTLQLTLRRAPGPEGAQELVIESAETSIAPTALRLDGAPLPGAAALPWLRDDTVLRLTSPDAIARVIDLIRNGRQLGIAGDGADAGTSLSGLTAALLLVDEHQQRLDTRGAWLRRGARADADVPPAPSLPTLPSTPAAPPALKDADGARLIAMVRRTQATALRAEECEEQRAAGDDTGFDITSNDSAMPFDATRALVSVTCLSGAYQASSLVFLAPRDGHGSATRVKLPQLPFDAGDEGGGHEDGGDRFAMLTNADYDPRTGVLSHFAKGRGLADCGESASWRYDGQAFRLAAFAQMTRCRGGAPGDWPTLWRTAGSGDGD